MPVRKIQKSYRNVTGIIFDSDSVQGYSFESTLERDFLLLLKFDQSIRCFEEQPLQIKWIDAQGKEHRYTPDTRVDYYDDRPSTIFEVKYRNDLRENWKDLRPKFKAAVSHCRANGMRFRIITDYEIRTPYLKNVQFLVHFQKLIMPQPLLAHHDYILAYLATHTQTTPALLLQNITPDKWEQASIMPVIWHLIANHKVDANLNEIFGMDSEIRSTE